MKTTIGISNVSFGLPNRELLNSVFLSAALCQGLDLPILDPLSAKIQDTINSFNVLWNYDKQSTKYINTYSSSVHKSTVKESSTMDITNIIISGMKDLAALKPKNFL